MVWGMALPVDFGDFFPDGEYLGWREGLIDYYENKMSAEQQAQFLNPFTYPFYVMFKFKQNPEWQGSEKFPPFSPIEPHERPTRFTLRKNYKSLGSLIETVDRIFAADEALKDIIERFEPGKHQFFPLEIDMPESSGFQRRPENNPRRFFIMVIGQYIDSFSMEHSDPKSWRKSESGALFFRNVNLSMSGLALSKQAFGAAHLWRESRMTSELICFSDALMSEIRKARLRLPEHYQLMEI